MTVNVCGIKRELDRMGVAYETGVPGARLTTFGSGGIVDLLIKPKRSRELVDLIRLLGSDGYLIGGGSNVLLPDEGLSALIRLDAFSDLISRDGSIFVGAGVKMPMLSAEAEKRALSGVEFASGIPGTVGGAVATNAGAFGDSVADRLRYIVALVEGKEILVDARELAFSHHRAALPSGAIVLAAVFSLAQGDKPKIRARINEMREKRSASQPCERSAGSVFRKNGETPAALYIEKTGLKGLKIGGAKLSEKHCNFIVNEGGASSHDYFAVAEIVKERVFKEQGVHLNYEAERIGW